MQYAYANPLLTACTPHYPWAHHRPPTDLELETLVALHLWVEQHPHAPTISAMGLALHLDVPAWRVIDALISLGDAGIPVKKVTVRRLPSFDRLPGSERWTLRTPPATAP